MRDDSVNVTTAAGAAAEGFCRGCGYSLRGLGSGRCPECGRAFDRANQRTFARRPPRLRLWRWVRRISAVLAVAALAIAAVPGWYGWQWRSGQALAAELRAHGAVVRVARVEPEGLAKRLPARWAFLHEHPVHVWACDLPPGRVDDFARVSLTHVEELYLWRSHVGDATLARFRGLAHLRRIELHGNPLDGSGLSSLSACRALEELDLRQTKLNDAGLARVGGLAGLRRLRLDDTAVTDAGLASVARLTALENLGLERTGITDAGLAQLVGLKSLRDVWVGGTRVTLRGRRDFARWVPGVRFHD